MTFQPIPTRLCKVVAPLLATLALAACTENPFDSTGSNSGHDSSVTKPATNRAPTISGVPPTIARVNEPYDFRPRAADPDGDPLRFEIIGRPSWATFNPNTGRLYGTPPAGTTGSFPGIEILVTDGKASATLPTFVITMSNTPGNGSAELAWTIPTTNEDGTELTDLAGFRIYYGQLPDAPSERIEVANPGATTTVIDGLSSGTWYFSITAFTKGGVESARTRPVWKAI